MKEVTHDSSPQALTQLLEKVGNIERMLLEKSNEQPQPEADQLLTVQQCADFLSLSVPSIYGLIHKGELPVMKRSKRCYFLKSDLIAYLKAGRKQPSLEVEAEAAKFLSNSKRK